MFQKFFKSKEKKLHNSQNLFKSQHSICHQFFRLFAIELQTFFLNISSIFLFKLHSSIPQKSPQSQLQIVTPEDPLEASNSTTRVYSVPTLWHQSKHMLVCLRCKQKKHILWLIKIVFGWEATRIVMILCIIFFPNNVLCTRK